MTDKERIAKLERQINTLVDFITEMIAHLIRERIVSDEEGLKAVYQLLKEIEE